MIVFEIKIIDGQVLFAGCSRVFIVISEEMDE